MLRRNSKQGRRAKAERKLVRPLVSVEALEGREVPAAAFALSGTNLIAFDTDNPAAANAPVAITGVTTGQTLVGIDIRPQTGQLYGLGYEPTAGTVQLYAISPRTGTATAVGTTGTFVDATATVVRIGTDASTAFGFDFNPAADRIRVVTSKGQDFRMDPNTGAFVDGDLGGAKNSVAGLNTDGPISGATTAVDGAAYTNNVPNTTKTTLYTLDASTDKLYLQNGTGNPNTGIQTGGTSIVTPAGDAIDFTDVTGFDIGNGVDTLTGNLPVVAGTGFATLTVGGASKLYSIDLTTGKATSLGAVAGATTVNGLAVQSTDAGLPVIAYDATTNTLLRFNSTTPGTATASAAVGGLVAGETLVGIDLRPATGQLIGLGVDPTANTATLYVIDPQTAAATVLVTGKASGITFFETDGTTPIDLPDPATTGYGFDFNPTVDRIRVTTEGGLNLRLNPVTGLGVDGDGTGVATNPDATNGVNTDGDINGLPTGSTGVSAAAYTNSFGGASKTTLYTLDAASNSLFVQNGANAGTQTKQVGVTLANVPLDFTAVNGFDIAPGVNVTTANAQAAGVGYAALTVGGVTNLYSIDLTTGKAALVGLPPSLNALSGLTVGDGPGGTIEFTSATFSKTEAGPGVDLTLTRTGGTGAVSVTVSFAAGTAGGDDYTFTPVTVTFADGETTATATVPLTNDTTFEGDETFFATLGGATNGAVVGEVSKATVTITDNDTQPTVTISDAKVTEGNAGKAALTFTVTLSNASTQTITVTADTADDTATAGTDYTALAGKVITFAPGETTQTFTVDVAGDTVFEADETFDVTLSAPTNATLGATAAAVGTITNDDTAPVVSINNVTAVETNTGKSAFTFTVTLSNASDAPVTVLVNTKDGTAKAGTDYTAVSGQLVTFAAGETTQTVTVQVNGDIVNEADETFSVVLSDPTGGATVTTGKDAGTGTITNDDALPSVGIDSVAKVEGNAGTTAYTFTVSIKGGSEQTITVSVATANNTATAGSDYTALAAQTLTFAPGETTKTVTVTVTGDTTVESDETFFVLLSNATNASADDNKGVGTILNDDTGSNPTASKTLLVGSPNTAVGAGSGTPTVRVIAADGTQVSSAAAFGSGFTGGVRTAVADVNGDGTPDVIVGSGPGTASLVRVLDGSTGKELFSVAPFEAAFTGGVFVAAGDVNGDGVPDVVVSPDQGGGPRVDIFNGKNFEKIDSFLGIEDPNFRGGARVAVGDVDGDGVGDLAVAAGFQGGPRVAVFDGSTLGTGNRVKLFNDFFAFEQTLRNGVFIAIGDVDGDGFGDIIAGGGPGGGPRVTVFDADALMSSKGATLSPLANFFAGDVNNRLGVQIAVKDVDGDNKADLRTVVGGSDTVTTYLGKSLTPTGSPNGTTADGLPDFTGGVFVG